MQGNVAFGHLLVPCCADLPEIADAGNKWPWDVRNPGEVARVDNVAKQKKRKPDVELGKVGKEDVLQIIAVTEGLL